MTDDIDAVDFDAPALPGLTRCPECGAAPTDDSVREVQLSDLGYLHGDYKFTCADCGARWRCGVPVGTGTAMAADLWCDSCGDAFMYVHRILGATSELRGDSLRLHVKCPNHEPVACPDCGATVEPRWTPAGAECPRCGRGFRRDGALAGAGCFNFEVIRRPADDQGRVLVGYPAITGSLATDRAYGYPTAQNSDRPRG